MAAEELAVVLNRDRLNEASAPREHAVDGPFTVVLENEGQPVHVHLHLAGPVAEVASLSGPNHYLDGGATRRVDVELPAVEEAVSGVLEVVTGHGADAVEVELTVEPSEEPGVTVDESLSMPRAAVANDEADDGPLGGLADRTDLATLLVAGFALVALALGFVLVLTLQSLAVAFGLLAVVLAVGAALYVLLGP